MNRHTLQLCFDCSVCRAHVCPFFFQFISISCIHSVADRRMGTLYDTQNSRVQTTHHSGENWKLLSHTHKLHLEIVLWNDGICSCCHSMSIHSHCPLGADSSFIEKSTPQQELWTLSNEQWAKKIARVFNNNSSDCYRHMETIKFSELFNFIEQTASCLNYIFIIIVAAVARSPEFCLC